MKSPARWEAPIYALATSVVGGLVALGYGIGIEPRWIEVVRLNIEMPRLSPQFNGYRIVQISDFHMGDWITPRRLDTVVSMINKEDADLIAITGDYVTSVYSRMPGDLIPPLARLRARDGKVWVLGNHDYWGGKGSGPVRYAMAQSGAIDLNNKVHTVSRGGEHLYIAGVDSARELMSRLDRVLARLPEEGAAILLAHEPDFGDESAASGRFDLQLSGHSHGGQIVIPFLGPPRLPPLGRKYPRGLYRVGNMALYTNRGIGMVGVPVRFLARPEITVVTLIAPG